MIPIVPVSDATPASRLDRTVNAVLAPGPSRLLALPPLSLYVHIPWCVRKCPYCDFNSHENAAGVEHIPEMEYVDALIRDVEENLPLVWGRRIHSIFLGGGTPSLFSAAALDRLLCAVRALLPVEADAEVTLEANPGTAEANKFADFRALGITRLSIGIQSFDDRALAALGRIHDGAQAAHAIALAQRHFDNFNLDLMYALPGQTQARALADLETALSFEPAHLSFYHLTIEPNTVFAKYPPVLPDDDCASAIEEASKDRLGVSGYRHYEISAYAKPGRESRHNLNYWNFGDYLGIGAGAHAKLSFPSRILRQIRHRQPATYLARARSGQSTLAEAHEVTERDLPFEFMLNLLRLVDGFPVARFLERTGLPITAIQTPLDRAERAGLLERDHKRIWPTERGLRFLNDLQEIFLPD